MNNKKLFLLLTLSLLSAGISKAGDEPAEPKDGQEQQQQQKHAKQEAFPRCPHCPDEFYSLSKDDMALWVLAMELLVTEAFQTGQTYDKDTTLFFQGGAIITENTLDALEGFTKLIDAPFDRKKTKNWILSIGKRAYNNTGQDIRSAILFELRKAEGCAKWYRQQQEAQKKENQN